MITVKYYPVRFERKGNKIFKLAYSPEKRLGDYLAETGLDLQGQEIILHGKCVTNKNHCIFNKSEIIITPKIEIPVIVGIVKAIVAIVTSTWFMVAATVLMVGFAIYSAITARKKMPTFGTIGFGLDESSPTYGWEGIRTIQEVGVPVKVIYGEHRTGGNILNQFVSTDGDKQYLNLLIGLCEGEIESIDDILINDNPIENFSGITTYKRYGTKDQSVIPHFEDLHNTYPINIQLNKDAAYTYTTVDNDVEAFEIYLTLPNGLFQINDSGAVLTWSVTYKVEYKLHTDVSWTDLGSTTISAKSRTAVRRIFRKESLTAGQYDIRVTKTSADSSLDPQMVGDLYLTLIDEIKTDDLRYPNTALLGLRILATDQLSGSTPNVTCVIKGTKVLIPFIEAEGGGEIDWDDLYWDAENELWKKLSDDTNCYWDGVTFVKRWTANPIWCIRDLLTHPRYGLGEHITEDDIDLDRYIEMAKYCEERLDDGNGGYEKRFQLDVVIDSPSKAPDLLSQLCAVFRGFSFYSEGKFLFRIDKIDDVVQVFGMGNIIKNNFQQSWKSKNEVYNVIEIQFSDRDLDYKDETIVVNDEASLALGDPIKKKTIRLFTTRKSYAIREGRYALWVSKYINRSAVIRVGIDAVACQAGDVVAVSHDVPQWGFSGRVKDGSTSTLIKLDRQVAIESGKTYGVGIRHNDDTLEVQFVTSTSGYYTEVETTAFAFTPSAYDVYIFGQIEIIAKLFRMVGVKKEKNGEIDLALVEYNESIYDDSAVVLPTNNYSALSNTVPPVLDLALTERIFLNQSGQIENAIDVWFTKPTMSGYYLKRYAKAKIFLSDDGGLSWQYRGETTDTHYAIIGDIPELKTYTIAVVSVSDRNEENAISDSPQEDIYLLGKTAPPDDVTGFDVYQEGNLLKFQWDANDDVDLARYIIKKGSDWDTGQLIAEQIDVTDFMYPVGEVGILTFMIKAVDSSGNESVTPTSDTLTVIPPPDMNFINNYDFWKFPHEFKRTNVEEVWANFHNEMFMRKTLALRTAKTWEELEAEGKTWEALESDGELILDQSFETSGNFEMIEPIDLQTIFNFKIVLDADYRDGDNCTITVQISTSEDGVTYSAFADVDANTAYNARYIKFKILIATSDAAYNAYLFDLLIYINAPSVKVAWGQDVAIPIGGKSLVFDVGFTRAPRFIPAIVNGVIGVIKADNKTKDGVDIMVYDLSSNPIGTAEIDWEAKGY